MPREKKNKIRKDKRYRRVYHGIPFYSRISDDDAKAKRDEYIRNEKRGFSRQTVEDYALPWLKRTYPAVADTTYTGLAIHLQHLVDQIGKKQLSEVIPSDIKQVYADQYAGLSNSYIRSAKQLYCALFDAAQADGLIKFNPAREKSAKPHTGKKPKERKLSKQERHWIETLCTDHRAWPAVMCMLYAGLRPQECKALKIDRDVDFENDVITVRQTAHIDGQKYAFTADMKTDWSSRQVPLFPPLKQALKGRRGYVITSAHGEQVTLSTWRVVWDSYLFCMETAINGVEKRWYRRTREHKKILAEADALRKEGKKQAADEKEKEIPAWIDFDIVPYTLRHAFCAFCRDSGVEINTCRRWMGHADAKMILKVYDTVSEDREENERQKIEKRWIQVQNEVQQDQDKPQDD